MKAKHRHELKENAFAAMVARASEWVAINQGRAIAIGGTVVAVLAVVGAVSYWNGRTNDAAGARLGEAIAISQTPIAPTSTLLEPEQAAGTFPTEEARRTAAIEAFTRVFTEFPSTSAALTARYQLGGVYLEAGQYADAEGAFTQVRADAGASIYGALARLGEAQAAAGQGRHDDAVALLTELAADRTTDLPLDGVLMQLAQTSLKAGKTDDARAAFRRIVDEFPTSAYVAQANRELDKLG